MKLLKPVDYFLDRITMYRLVLYVLIAVLTVATVAGYFGAVPYSPLSIILSTAFLIGMGWAANTLFSFCFDAPANVESVYITALILALIISPTSTSRDFIFLGWAAILAMGSKFILAVGKKHFFNPAAVAVVITMYVLGQSASWWVGTAVLAPIVLAGGYLVIRKLRYEDLAWSFFMTFAVVSLGITLMKGGSVIKTLEQLAFHSSLLFMGSIMVTEPMTLPPTNTLQMIFGAIVGFLAVPQVHIGNMFFAPELALCIGNVFAYLVSPKTKLVLYLHKKISYSPDILDFIFKPEKPFSFVPGQYMEWTLPHNRPDSRGNRRYFTLASSPTEDTVRLGIKFYENGSTYKQALKRLDSATPLIGAQIAGDFTLPKDTGRKLAFIAGGIGITPFRSMIKYLVDTGEMRDIVLFYVNKTADEIAYRDVFDAAEESLGIRTVYSLTSTHLIPTHWCGERGRIDHEMIQSHVPDYRERLFYLSGPQTMVNAYEKTLRGIGVPESQIKKDFFPGFA